MKKLMVIPLVLVLLAAAGYIAWSGTDNGIKNEAKSNQNTQPQNDPSESGKYLVIKEWGVKFEIPEELRGDISYYMNDKAYRDFGSPVFVSILSNKISEGDMKCAVIEGDAPRDILDLEKMTEGVNGIRIDPPEFKTIGQDHYYLSSTACEEAATEENHVDNTRIIRSLRSSIEKTLTQY